MSPAAVPVQRALSEVCFLVVKISVFFGSHKLRELGLLHVLEMFFPWWSSSGSSITFKHEYLLP